MRNENKLLRFINQNLVLLGIIVLITVTAVIQPKFLMTRNLTNILRQMTSLAFVALGMTFVIIGGFIDLSVVGMVSLVSVITASLINPIGQVGALLCGLLAGALLGYLNGTILTKFGATIQAEVLFITYGMSSVFIAVGLLVTNAETLRIARSTRPYDMFTAIGSGSFLGIPISILIFAVILAIMYFFQTRTLAGRSISLMGGNKTAAYLCGFNINRTMQMVYTINGLMSAFGSIVLMSRVTTATATLGTGYEANAILCVVVGGTTLAGGKGNVLRTLLGVFLITLLSNCMNLLGLSTYMQTVMNGAVLVTAIWLDNRKRL